MLSGVLAQDLPVVQRVRGGGLVARVGLWLASEAKGLTDGHVGLHGKHGSVSHLRLLQGMDLLLFKTPWMPPTTCSGHCISTR